MAEGGTVVALLAAGSARRFGGDKLDCDLGGRPLGAWAAATAQALPFARRLMVTPPVAPRFAQGLEGWDRVVNAEPERGLASSIRTAAVAALGADRLVILLADMPFVEAAHLERLARESAVAFTAYPDGNRGVPAAFPEAVLAVLRNLADDQRVAALDFPRPVVTIDPRSPETLVDIDTEAALSFARGILAAQ